MAKARGGAAPLAAWRVAYFACAGPAPRAAAADARGDPPPALLARYPPEDHAGMKLPPELATCCLPAGAGAGAAPARGATERYPIVLTDGEGRKVYAACAVFRGSGGGAVCACLLSLRPALAELAELLDAVVASAPPGGDASDTERIGAMVRAAAAVVDAGEGDAGAAASTKRRPQRILRVGRRVVACAPPPRAPRLTADVAAEAAQLSHQAPLAALMEVSASCLERAWVACLLERRVLLRARRPAMLTLAAEALRSLLAPLVWQHVYIPVLPLSLADALEAPTPFLMGLINTAATDADGLQLGAVDGVVEVDLDTSEVTWPRGELLPLPKRTRTHLRRGLGDALVARGDGAARAGPPTEAAMRAVFGRALRTLLPRVGGERAEALEAAGKGKDQQKAESFLEQLHNTQAFLSYEAGGFVDEGAHKQAAGLESIVEEPAPAFDVEYFTPCAPPLPEARATAAAGLIAERAAGGDDEAEASLAAALARTDEAALADAELAASVAEAGEEIALAPQAADEASRALSGLAALATNAARWDTLWSAMCCARLLTRADGRGLARRSLLADMAREPWNSYATLRVLLSRREAKEEVALLAAACLQELGWGADQAWDIVGHLRNFGFLAHAERASVRAAIQHAHELRRDACSLGEPDGDEAGWGTHAEAEEGAISAHERELFEDRSACLLTAKAHAGRVRSVCGLSAAGDVLASCAEDDTLALTRLGQGEEGATTSSIAIAGGAGALHVGAIDEGRVACVLQSGGVLVADATGGRQVATSWKSSLPEREARSTTATAAATAPGGAPLVAVGTSSGSVYVWDVRCPPGKVAGFWRCAPPITLGAQPPSAHAFSPVTAVALSGGLATPGAASAGGGMVLATGTQSGGVHAWDMRSSEPLLREHGACARAVTSLGLAPSSDTLVAGGGDWSVRTFRLSGGRAKDRVLVGHGGAVTGVSACADTSGRLHILSADETGASRLWSMDCVGAGASQRTVAPSLGVGRGAHASMQMLPAGDMGAISATTDGRVRAWHVHSDFDGPARVVARGSMTLPHSVTAAVRCGGQGGPMILAAGGADGSVSLWRP